MLRIFRIALCSVIFFSSLVSCNHSTRSEKSGEEEIKKETQGFPSPPSPARFSPDTCLKPFYRLPDSLLRPDEIRIKRRYLHLLYTYLSVEDNQYIFHLSKDSFIKEGIPGIYYDELLYSIQQTNQWVNQMRIDTLPALFEGARSTLQKQLGNDKEIP